MKSFQPPVVSGRTMTGVRLIGNSFTRESPSSVWVNSRRRARPRGLEAVGDPAAGAVRDTGGVSDRYPVWVTLQMP